MNNPHQNARTTFHSRELIVTRHREGRRASVIAEELGISVRTVHKWLSRFRRGGLPALANAPSVPIRKPRRLPPHRIALVLHLRRTYRLTAAAIADKLGLARSTVARWLTRHGIGKRAALEPREPPNRYQRDRPGELIHIDIKKLGRFDRPGHRATGARKGNRNRGAGWDFVHVAIDDATRLAYVEVLPDERKETATAFLTRALAWFAARGVAVERVMTDNGSCYRAKLFGLALNTRSIRHIRTRPYTPKTNGKAERFIQTLMREWAYAHSYPSADARSADLPRWLDWYNTGRPHSALNASTPASAMNNLMRSHS
jgi:transposase InsO family protein